jgi:LPXTG-motif cell wall-anchored protein
MHKMIQTYPWAIALVGVVMVVIGQSQTYGQEADGTGKQMFFDLVAIVGFVLVLGSAVVWFRSRKKNSDE